MVKPRFWRRILFRGAAFALYPVLVIPLTAICFVFMFALICALWFVIPFCEVTDADDSLGLRLPPWLRVRMEVE